MSVWNTPGPAEVQSVPFPPISALTASALASATKLWQVQVDFQDCASKYLESVAKEDAEDRHGGATSQGHTQTEDD